MDCIAALLQAVSRTFSTGASGTRLPARAPFLLMPLWTSALTALLKGVLVGQCDYAYALDAAADNSPAALTLQVCRQRVQLTVITDSTVNAIPH